RRRTPGDLGASRLALRELEPAAGTATAVLLALLHAAVAREQPVLAEHRVVRRVDLLQRAREAEHDRVGLAGRTAALDVDQDVERAFRGGGLERLEQAHARLRRDEVLVGVATVDDEAAGAGLHAHARDRRLAAAETPGELAGAHEFFFAAGSTLTGC